MKNIIKTVTIVTLVAFILVSFATIDKKEIKLDKSKIVWKGYKVTGSHEGTIALKSGKLEFNKSKLGLMQNGIKKHLTTSFLGNYDFLVMDNFVSPKILS